MRLAGAVRPVADRGVQGADGRQLRIRPWRCRRFHAGAAARARRLATRPVARLAWRHHRAGGDLQPGGARLADVQRVVVRAEDEPDQPGVGAEAHLWRQWLDRACQIAAQGRAARQHWLLHAVIGGDAVDRTRHSRRQSGGRQSWLNADRHPVRHGAWAGHDRRARRAGPARPTAAQAQNDQATGQGRAQGSRRLSRKQGNGAQPPARSGQAQHEKGSGKRACRAYQPHALCGRAAL